MLFNTLDFWVFFAVVFLVYLLLERRAQNVFLLLASYFFYACWSVRFLLLLLLSNAIDWVLGRAIWKSRDQPRAKHLVALSVTLNLLFLGCFKYCNFFVDSLNALLASLGLPAAPFHFDLVLPVGISFYTFQSMSYIVDVYRGDVTPAENPVDFALFVAFFPHMVAGPIMHSNVLLPQMQTPRRVRWEAVMSGFHLAMWGLFKKVLIADNLARVAGPVFSRQWGFQPGTLHLGVLAFAFQIYCDFSGYTDIARGVARMMGFTLMDNFNHPYFSTSITDFWRRWHISLSSWLRDYLYIPLGGNRSGPFRTYRNLFLTMLLGGLWHGAGWTFVLWGAYQGLLLVVERLLGGRRLILDWGQCTSLLERAVFVLRVLVCFHFVCLGWLIFRCEKTRYLRLMIPSFMDVRGWWYIRYQGSDALYVLALIVPLLVVELVQCAKRDEQVLLRMPWALRAAVYTAGAYAFILWGRFDSNPFIYFRF
jgi:D-alanyl-lipoteichoic acid acyltransferase DltB (MBOAT superfamily)